MKARIYFIVSAIISFILSIYSIIVSNETIKTTLESLKKTYADFPQSFQDRIIGVYEKSGVKLTILFGIIVIVCSIILFVLAKKNTLVRNKGLVVALSILTIFFTDRLLVQLLGICDLVIILCCKRKNPEDFKKKEKKEIPKLSIEKSNKKEIVLSLLLIIAYFSQFIWSKWMPDDYDLKLISQILFNIFMIFLSILVFYKQIKINFKLFINNFETYIKFIIPKLGIAYLFLFVASLISTLITKNAVSVNQEAVESLPLYYMIFAAVIYAPIVEEIIFRGAIRRFIRNDKIFVVISALTFGILHTMGESSFVNVIVMALPYATLGFYLSYIYTKTNNIFSNIVSHMIFNSISCLFIILI